MYVPYDEKMKIVPQDDEFLSKQPWDFRNTPADHYPLLLFYHPLNIYRKQVIKQADVVLAMFLLGDTFSPETKKRNFDFYDPLTTGDSSLSSCVEAIIAAQTGDIDKAIRYGMAALLMTESVREAQLKRTEAGLIPQGEGWFVLNAHDVSLDPKRGAWARHRL